MHTQKSTRLTNQWPFSPSMWSNHFKSFQCFKSFRCTKSYLSSAVLYQFILDVPVYPLEVWGPSGPQLLALEVPLASWFRPWHPFAQAQAENPPSGNSNFCDMMQWQKWELFNLQKIKDEENADGVLKKVASVELGEFGNEYKRIMIDIIRWGTFLKKRETYLSIIWQGTWWFFC